MSTHALEKRINHMIEAIAQRVEALQPTYDFILYKPVKCEPGMTQAEYDAQILREQPEVKEQLARFRSQGVPVIFMLPEKDSLPGSEYAA